MDFDLFFFFQAGATPLLDNDPRDKYPYEVVLYTGARKNGGMSLGLPDKVLLLYVSHRMGGVS